MSFTERFDSFVCPGDTITCEVDGFTVMAAIVLELRGSENAPMERFPEQRPDAPDQRQDGFWPSLYINDPGFIGEADQKSVQWTDFPPERNGFRERFAKAQAEAEAVMEAWRKGDWFYCGIVLSVALEGITLVDQTGIYGVEANYPGADNAYLTEVANDLLPEALGVLARLRAVPAGEGRA